jgi:hypothetical protein
LLGQIARQSSKIIWSADSSENKDCGTVHSSQQAAWTAKMRLKIIEILQQHDDVLAAGGKVGRTGRAFGAQALKLSEYVWIPPVREDMRGGWQRMQQSLQDRLGQESVPKHPD